MKAALCTAYGPPDQVLTVGDVAKPTPQANETLVRIHAATVSSGDARIRGFNLPTGFGILMRLGIGFSKPRNPILGYDLAGVVEAVGSAVTRFKPGDQVFGTTGIKSGTHAEYICLPEDGQLVLKPEHVSFEEAAAVPFGGTTAIYYLRDLGQVQAGQKVLVVGASGAVGVYTVQVARHFGADVTGVCSAANVDLVKSLEADHVIDYTQEDFTQNGQQYDLIIDTVGATTYSQCKGSLAPNGTLGLVVAGIPQFGRVLWTALFGSRKVKAGIAAGSRDDILLLKDWLESGAITPVIDRTYPLESIVEAHRYVDTGRKRGSVVIKLVA